MSERRGSRGSVDQATEGDRKEEDEGDGMDEDEDDGKAITVKETSKVSKAAAARNTARRSGRKR